MALAGFMLAQDRDEWPTILNTVINIWGSQNGEGVLD